MVSYTRKPRTGEHVTLRMKAGAPWDRNAPEWEVTGYVVRAWPETPPDGFGLYVKESYCQYREIRLRNVLSINGKPVVLAPQETYQDLELSVTGSSGDKYVVRRVKNRWSCTCPGFTFRHRCRHIDEAKERSA